MTNYDDIPSGDKGFPPNAAFTNSSLLAILLEGENDLPGSLGLGQDGSGLGPRSSFLKNFDSYYPYKGKGEEPSFGAGLGLKDPTPAQVFPRPPIGDTSSKASELLPPLSLSESLLNDLTLPPSIHQEKLNPLDFRPAVEELSPSSVLHVLPGREVPRNIGEYELVPIWQTTLKGTLVPSSVRCNYQEEGGKPVLDSNFAIGLVFRGTLAAVGGACTSETGNLRIVQLQAVYSDASDSKKKFKTGLHGGFYWRDTLVQAWIEIAAKMGMDNIEIQPAAQNVWWRRYRSEQLREGYDAVAERMGFTYDLQNNCWQRAIS